MIQCPRCGFSQPKDRYCANCGVNMESYTPTPAPLWQKLLKNTGVQIVLAIGAVVSIVTVFYATQDKEFKDRLLGDQNQTQEVTQNEPAIQPPAPNEAGSNNNNAATESRSAIEARAKNNTRAIPESADTSGFAAPEEEKTATKNAAGLNTEGGDLFADGKATAPVEIVVSLVSLPLDGSGNFNQMSYSSSGSAKAYAITATDLAAFYNTYPQVSELTSRFNGDVDGEPIDVSSTFNYQGAAEATGDEGGELEELGLILLVRPNVTEDKYGVSLEGQISLKMGEENQTVTNDISGQFSVQHGQILVISGLFPKSGLADSMSEMLAGSPLQLLTLEEYQSGSSDLALVISGR